MCTFNKFWISIMYPSKYIQLKDVLSFKEIYRLKKYFLWKTFLISNSYLVRKYFISSQSLMRPSRKLRWRSWFLQGWLLPSSAKPKLEALASASAEISCSFNSPQERKITMGRHQRKRQYFSVLQAGFTTARPIVPRISANSSFTAAVTRNWEAQRHTQFSFGISIALPTVI